MAGRTERVILETAARAAGVCTRAELLAAGLPARTISDRVRAGLLTGVGPGIYEVAALVGPDTPCYRAARAHPAGAISHRAAGRLWGLPVGPPEWGEPIEVTVPCGSTSRARLAGVTLHRTRRWFDEDLAEPRPGLRATGPARTIVDLAGKEVGDRRLRHVVQTAVVARRVSLAEVAACLDRVGARGVAGSGRLRRVLSALDDGQPIPESELEGRLAPVLGRRFRRQYRPPWYDGRRGVVDFAEPESRVIVEADGRRWHASEQAMVEDRRRDRVAATHGWLVLRVTWDDVAERPEALATEVAEVVAGRVRAIA